AGAAGGRLAPTDGGPPTHRPSRRILLAPGRAAGDNGPRSQRLRSGTGPVALLSCRHEGHGERMQRGYVYIIMMSSAHPYLKIGKTAGPTEKRAAELSSDTGVPLRYAVAYEVELLYYEEAEWEIHARLKHCRVNPRREFFEIPLKDAI